MRLIINKVNTAVIKTMLCPERTAAPTVNIGFANKEAQSH